MGKMKYKGNKRTKKVMKMLSKDLDDSLSILHTKLKAPKIKTKKPKKKRKKEKDPRYIFNSGSDMIRIKDHEVTLYDPGVQFRFDKRFYISFVDFNRRTFEMQYLGKRKKKNLEIVVLPFPNSNGWTSFSIPYQDSSYILLETAESIDFPSLHVIKNPFLKKGKSEPALIEVGSDDDLMPNHIRVMEDKLISYDETHLFKLLKAYRVKRRVYERLISKFIYAFAPTIKGDIEEHEKFDKTILFPLQSSGEDSHDFFHYVIGGFIFLKNGRIYQLMDLR